MSESKTVFLMLNFDKEKDSDLFSEYAPLSLLLADCNENHNTSAIKKLDEINNMIANSPKGSVFTICVTKL